MDEQRKATRVGLVSEVQIQRGVPEVAEATACGIDLSEGGMGILLWNNSLQRDEEIDLKISVPGFPDPIAMKGTVVWTQPVKPGFRVGIRFKEVNALGQARILQLVADRLAPLPAATVVQPTTPSPVTSAPPAKPLRVRRPWLAILLAVGALALLLQNAGLRRSVQELKATVAALQSK